MPILMHHKGITFRDQVVYLTGHAYEDCVFERCTLVHRGAPTGVMIRCTMAGCVWHLDLLISDSDDWDGFMSTTAAAITKSLPRVRGES